MSRTRRTKARVHLESADSGLVVRTALRLFVAGAMCFALLAQASPQGAADGPSALSILRGLDEYSLRRASLKFSAMSLVSSLLGGPTYSPPTSTLAFSFPTRLDTLLTSTGTKYVDRIDQDLARRNLGSGPVLDVGALFRPRETAPRPIRKRRASEVPLPTPREAAVLAQLWNNGPQTSLDLYASLDSSLLAGITAEMFWQELHRMARRGFVEERIISPQNLLTIGVGPFAIPVEMSAKNKQNRIWLYRPLVEREDMIRYLDARRYLASNSDRPWPGVDMYERLLRILRAIPPDTTGH